MANLKHTSTILNHFVAPTQGLGGNSTWGLAINTGDDTNSLMVKPPGTAWVHHTYYKWLGSNYLDTYPGVDDSNPFNGWYLRIYGGAQEEILSINTVGGSVNSPPEATNYRHLSVVRAQLGTTMFNWSGGGATVQIWDGIPFEPANEIELTTQSTTTSETTFLQEEVSSGFGVPGITIEQTLLNTFDPYSGMDIDATIFQNTDQALEDSNIDGRIELGMFSFNDDNIASDSFPNVLGQPFTSITKTNMVNNGDCKFVEKAYHEEDDIPIIVKPEGDWMFLSLHDITYTPWIENYTDEDVQGFTGYGGRYAYVPLSLEIDGSAGFNYWGNVESIQTFLLSTRYLPTTPQQSIVNSTNNGALQSIRNQYRLTFDAASQPVPHIAAWVVTNEAYSNKKCLQFMNFSLWNASEVYNYTRDYNPPQAKYPFNWLLKSEHQHDGEITSDTYSNSDVIQDNQYRVLNQVQKIYDKFNDEPLNPHSSLKIRFKMKTTHVLPPGNSLDTNDMDTFRYTPLDESLGYAPTVEIGILQSQFEEIPKSGVFSVPHTLYGEVQFKAPGNFNSERYFNGSDFVNKRESELGGMSRFQNSIMNEWETFEFDYNLREEHNNRGLIYGVPYGGSFDDKENGGSIEIMINHNTNDENGLPVPNPGEIYFKIPGYQEEDTRIADDTFFMITPDGQFRVPVKLGGQDSKDYMVVASQLGDGNPQTVTGEQSDGRFLEAYLMYVGGIGIQMSSGLDYGNTGDNNENTDMVVAYWNGERWSYDNNTGYNMERYLEPINNPDAPNCFILARLYSSNDQSNVGITGMDQYISNETQFPTDGIGNLALFLQSGNNFHGRVLIDDIECFESYEFTPEVDVRKKKSVGNYGLADLTKYYDKEIEPEKYKDTQAPLEAQFYFYPQYPTDETFVERIPIYQDFKVGRFYIYDIDWGDGTINEFTSKPEQINENTALYHTYEYNGVFEVTGTMIRVKTDRDNNIIGVAHNKKFKLRININEGLDEDFQYFGSNGYSFIPYKNTTPIIGGISKQSNYYKKTKRQLGFLNNEKINIEFKNKSDKLKTELALLKMENQINNNLEILPSYMIERFDNQGVKIYNGISPIREELGKSLGDVDLTSIKYYNKPKSIWELFDFNYSEGNINLLAKEGEFLNRRTGELVPIGTLYHIHPDNGPMQGGVHNSNISGGTDGHDFFDDTFAVPTSNRYWKNIIPQNYSISNRNGLINELIVRMQGKTDDVDSIPPHYNIIINGVNYYNGFITNAETDGGVGSTKSYDFNIPIDRSLDIQEIRIKYDNNETPSVASGQDRNLYVNSIQINGVQFDTFTSNGMSTHDDINVYYDTPNIYNYMENNPDQTSYNENGVSSAGAMAWNGDMVFEIPTKYFIVTIDNSSEQEWNDNYYYPVLPRFGSDGKFIENNFTNNNIPFPLNGNITNEDESDKNLLINIVNEKNDVEVFNDNSGNKNYGFSIQDFSPIYDEKTLRVEKTKKRSILKTSKQNGAF